MRRALLLVLIAGVLLVSGSGCSNSKKPRRTASSSSSSRNKVTPHRSLPKLGGVATGGSTKLSKVSGPKTMGTLVVDEWKKDLASSSSDKQILAANELGSMGAKAKSALPDLQKLASNRNPKVAAAAKEAIARIGR